MPVIAAIAKACERVAPLWPLTHFVAVNPFVGMTDLAFEEAVALSERASHARMLPGQSRVSRAQSVADLVDELRPGAGSGHLFVVDEISKWCASYFDQGQAVWPMPWRHLPLWRAWQEAASIDANPELMGLTGFRARVRDLDADPVAVIGRGLARLGVPVQAYDRYLLRLLLSTPGWSGFVQYRVRERQMAGALSDELTQLLAIRLTYDVALLEAAPQIHDAWHRIASTYGCINGDETADISSRHAELLAAEHAYQSSVAASLIGGPAVSAPATRPAVQAVFCIDVRSEVFRRALEAQSPEIQTLGFAGFFGLPLAYRANASAPLDARCPVLLSPSLAVEDGPAVSDRRGWLDSAWHSFQTSVPSCFAFVETAGLAFAGRLLQATRGGRVDDDRTPSLDAPLSLGLPIDDRVALAAKLLRGMGLTRGFAPVVLLCGHGSTTTNNPYGSSLDCGACGGHAGDINARAAATLLNDPWVRFCLTAANIVIPADTVFVAGLHDTTTDDVIADGLGDTITRWLSAAGREARRERAATFGFGARNGADLDQAVRRRSTDWACTRPEWGLAGNAAFIAAPRSRTRGVTLGGRAFLHEYDATADADGSVLELIMTAPMVVASWINLQYYASTIDNARFGSGNKLLHNVVGTFGVWQGNGGDLQVGLPWQSVHDGTTFRHDPLRLSVFLEAPTQRIDSVLQKHEPVRRLVTNGWIHLLAIEPSTGSIRSWTQGQWADADSHEPAGIAARA